VIDVNGMSYLIMHGHQVRGWMGKPYYGFDRKVGREAIKRMRSKLPGVLFDRLVMGHWHEPANTLDWIIGGSLSGTDAYDHKNGRYAPPLQPIWLVHPKHGEFDWTRIEL